MKVLAFPLLALMAPLWAAESNMIYSYRASGDFPLTADVNASHWRNIKPVVAENDHFGNVVPGHRTEIRSLWTKDHIYFLFTNPYQELNLKPSPRTDKETDKLWEYDVAEIFIGADFDKIWHYREYQVSPQGEWVDLDINRKQPLPEGGARWDSGFEVKARIDAERKIWYGEFKIPLRSIDEKPAEVGKEMRINLFRIQGPGPKRKYIVWQKTGVLNNHVPEAFGRIKLVTK